MRHLSAGHAVVDAMVAMMIVSLAIILGLRALQQAEQVSRQAEEVRSAHALLNDLMLARAGGRPAAGSARGFAWRSEIQTTGAERPIEVCRRGATLISHASRRVFSAWSLETCPAEVGG